jgi:hypothetical protein
MFDLSVDVLLLINFSLNGYKFIRFSNNIVMSFLYYPGVYTSRRLAEIEVESALRRSRVATEIALDRAYTS